jgi:hypothetical protein
MTSLHVLQKTISAVRCIKEIGIEFPGCSSVIDELNALANAAKDNKFDEKVAKLSALSIPKVIWKDIKVGWCEGWEIDEARMYTWKVVVILGAHLASLDGIRA